MHKLLALSTIAFSMAVTSTAHAGKEAQATKHRIDNLITNTWYMERVMGSPLTRTTRSYRRLQSVKYNQWVKHHWQRIHREVARKFHHPPHWSQFLCIKHYEGSWQDTGSPYWGGLQMDATFMRTYGGWLYRTKGTADHWTPLEQVWAAERAERTRGFWPWPNTARYCGLL